MSNDTDDSAPSSKMEKLSTSQLTWKIPHISTKKSWWKTSNFQNYLVDFVGWMEGHHNLFLVQKIEIFSAAKS